MPGIDLDLLAREYPNVAVAQRQVELINQVASVLRAMRKYARLTQADLAVALDVKQPRIAQIESGRPADAPSLHQIAAFAARCGFDINFESHPATAAQPASAVPASAAPAPASPAPPASAPSWLASLGAPAAATPAAPPPSSSTASGSAPLASAPPWPGSPAAAWPAASPTPPSAASGLAPPASAPPWPGAPAAGSTAASPAASPKRADVQEKKEANAYRQRNANFE
jgi:transcriptional regulator with XRE-family HTH domain